MIDVEARIEAVARATHAYNNSGVTVPWSPLSWESEQPALKEWHRTMARVAVAVVSAGYKHAGWLRKDGTHYFGGSMILDPDDEYEEIFRKVEPGVAS